MKPAYVIGVMPAEMPYPPSLPKHIAGLGLLYLLSIFLLAVVLRDLPWAYYPVAGLVSAIGLLWVRRILEQALPGYPSRQTSN